MTVLRNNFSTGPDGTDVTTANTGLGEDDPFDSYNNSAAADSILKFKTAEGLDRPTAEYVLRAATGTTASTQYVAWMSASMGGTQTQVWMREYVYFTTLPNNSTRPSIWFAFDTGSSQFRFVFGVDRVGPDTFIFCEDGAGSSLYTTTPLVAGQWFRVEARVQFGTTTGNGEVRFYAEPDADVDGWTEQLSFSNWTLGGTTSNFWAYGWGRSDTFLEDLYVSGAALSNEDWIGPQPFRAGKGVPGVLATPVAIHNDNR